MMIGRWRGTQGAGNGNNKELKKSNQIKLNNYRVKKTIDFSERDQIIAFISFN